jgi:hypothetical protein
MKRRSIMILAAVLLCFAAVQASAADTWFITTVAGTGKPGFSGDGGPATQAMFNFQTWNLCVDSSGCVYIADGGNNRVRKVDTAGIVRTVAGNGTRGFSGDGGPAIDASLNGPCGIAVDEAGNLYIADIFNYRVRKVDTAGIITTIAGNGVYDHSGDGGPALQAAVPPFLCALYAGSLYVCCNNVYIRQIDLGSGIVTTVAGTGTEGYWGDGGPAIKARIKVADMAFDQKGNLYLSDEWNRFIRKVDTAGIITTIAGGGWGEDDGPATKAYIIPLGVCVDADGKIWIADNKSHRIRVVDATGTIRTAAGGNGSGYSGDGGSAREAKLNSPGYVRLGPDGSIYFIDFYNYAVRKLYRK